MSAAKRNIPHFAYVEEVDVTELEALRQYLNSRQPKGTPSLTYLPFLVAALVRVLEKFPQCNALHDAERNLILRHAAVHVGVATQTPDGLKVPVVKHAEARSLADLAAEIRRVSEAARTNKATREELTGSTITGHEPRPARRHRLDARHQRARGRDRRRQQGRRAAGRHRTARSRSAAS